MPRTMTNRAILLLLSTTLLLLAACGGKDAQDTPQLSAERLERRIIALSSDEFLGRKPFTEGEKRTLTYLQEQFAEAGLEPAHGTSYLQEIGRASCRGTGATGATPV